MTPRPDIQREKKRVAAAASASRIGSLPVSLRFRAAIASSVLTSKMSWGALFNGRSPNTKQFHKIFKIAVHENIKMSGLPSRWQNFFFGVRGDILFVACQKFLKALMSWHATRPGLNLKLDTPVVQACKQALGEFQRNLNANGRVSWPDGFWDTSAPLGFCDRFAHNLRVHWRKIMLNSWLSADRNDASIAREANLSVSTEFVEKLHATASCCEGHEIAIVCEDLQTHVRLQNGSICVRRTCFGRAPDFKTSAPRVAGGSFGLGPFRSQSPVCFSDGQNP